MRAGVRPLRFFELLGQSANEIFERARVGRRPGLGDARREPLLDIVDAVRQRLIMALVARLGDGLLDFRRNRIESLLDLVEGRCAISISVDPRLPRSRAASVDALGKLRDLAFDPLDRQRPRHSRRQKIADLPRLALDILEGGGIDLRAAEIVELGAEPF